MAAVGNHVTVPDLQERGGSPQDRQTRQCGHSGLVRGMTSLVDGCRCLQYFLGLSTAGLLKHVVFRRPGMIQITECDSQTKKETLFRAGYTMSDDQPHGSRIVTYYETLP